MPRIDGHAIRLGAALDHGRGLRAQPPAEVGGRSVSEDPGRA